MANKCVGMPIYASPTDRTQVGMVKSAIVKDGNVYGEIVYDDETLSNLKIGPVGSIRGFNRNKIHLFDLSAIILHGEEES